MLAFIMMATLGVVALKSYWHPDRKPAVPYENAGKSLPVLKALAKEHVTYLKNQDGCRAYSDNREQRASKLIAPCPPKDNYQLFDNASEKRFTDLQSMLKDLPYDAYLIDIKYDTDGALKTASLSIESINPFKHDYLTYKPGYMLPADRPGQVENHRIDSDWYHTWEDWN